MTSDSKDKPNVLLIGAALEQSAAGHRHFSEAIRWLVQRAEVTRILSVSAATASHMAYDPSVVIVLHSVPGLVPVDVETQIETGFPGCPVAHLMGPWCEGEMRGLRPLPGNQVIPWHEWHSGLKACISLGAESDHPSSTIGRRASGALIGVATSDLETADCWYGVLRSIGFDAVSLSHYDESALARVSLVLWDEASAARAKPIPLRTLVQEVAPIPVVAAMSFIRPSDEQAVHEAGAVDILPKPYRARNVAQLINRHIPSSLSGSRADAPAA